MADAEQDMKICMVHLGPLLSLYCALQPCVTVVPSIHFPGEWSSIPFPRSKSQLRPAVPNLFLPFRPTPGRSPAWSSADFQWAVSPLDITFLAHKALATHVTETSTFAIFQSWDGSDAERDGAFSRAHRGRYTVTSQTSFL